MKSRLCDTLMAWIVYDSKFYFSKGALFHRVSCIPYIIIFFSYFELISSLNEVLIAFKVYISIKVRKLTVFSDILQHYKLKDLYSQKKLWTLIKKCCFEKWKLSAMINISRWSLNRSQILWMAGLWFPKVFRSEPCVAIFVDRIKTRTGPGEELGPDRKKDQLFRRKWSKKN